MLFWLVPLIVFVSFVVWGFCNSELGAGLGFGAILAALSVVLVLLAALLFNCLAPQAITETETYEIHALVDNVEYEGRVSGSVFLVRAYTNEELKYNYMYMVDGKGFAFNSVKAKDCYLNKTSETPYIVINHYDCSSGFINFLFGSHWSCHREYIFYLPQDAEIIDDFTVDLE
jgi:hypothetical protein